MPDVKRNAKGHFLPGYTPNPGGMPKEALQLKHLCENSRHKMLIAIFQTGSYSVEKIREILKDPKASAIEVVCATLYSKAMTGSLPHLQEIFNRTIGPVPKLLQPLDGDGKPATVESLQFTEFNADQLTHFVVQLKKKVEECRLIQSSSVQSQEPLVPSSQQESPTA